MKISVLINKNFYKICNILKIINSNNYLLDNLVSIIGYDNKNVEDAFKSATKQLQSRKYDKIIVFDNDGFLPYLFFAKQENITPAYPLAKEIAALTVQHNNANVFIISKQFIKSNDINDYLMNHLSAKFEGGRHEVRTKIMLDSWSKSNTAIKFNKSSKNIVICSDHGGFELKQKIIQYLTKKHIPTIDVGCFDTNSTHYPLWSIALGLSAKKAFCGIAICSSGVGISVTANKFKGLRCLICHQVEAAKIAKQKYHANVLGFGGKFVDKKIALKIVDTFLKTKNDKNKQFDFIDNYGFEFDLKKFRKIKIDKSIQLPNILK